MTTQFGDGDPAIPSFAEILNHSGSVKLIKNDPADTCTELALVEAIEANN
ncbi:hypothetical protein [Paracoccus sp. SJTW-4]